MYVGEESWLSPCLKSKLLFKHPPGLFHRFRKFILFFVVHIECMSRWAAFVLEEREMDIFVGTFVFRFEPGFFVVMQDRKGQNGLEVVEGFFLMWCHWTLTWVIYDIEGGWGVTCPVSCGWPYALVLKLFVGTSGIFVGKWIGNGTWSRQPVDVRGTHHGVEPPFKEHAEQYRHLILLKMDFCRREGRENWQPTISTQGMLTSLISGVGIRRDLSHEASGHCTVTSINFITIKGKFELTDWWRKPRFNKEDNGRLYSRQQ